MLHSARILFSITFTMLMSAGAWGLNINADPSIPFPNGAVNAMVREGNRIYVGGQFTQMGTTARNKVAALDAQTGALIESWDAGMASTGEVHCLATDGTHLYVGGFFTLTIPNTTDTLRNLVAFRLDDGGPAQLESVWRPQPDNVLFALMYQNSRLYAGGVFSKMGTPETTQTLLAAIETAGAGRSGAIDANWTPQITGGIIGAIFALAGDDDHVYAGGNFLQVNGQARENIVALSSSTGSAPATVNTAWTSGVRGGANTLIRTLATTGNWLVMGGGFSEVVWTDPQAGEIVESRASIAAAQLAGGSSVGAFNQTWVPTIGAPSIRSIRLQDDYLIVGGQTINSSNPVKGVCQISLPGAGASTRTDWLPVLESPAVTHFAFGDVYASERLGSNGVLIGGAIKTINGENRRNMAGFRGDVTRVRGVWAGVE